MKFTLEVDLPDDGGAKEELGRILRDCGEAMDDFDDIEPGDKQDIHDSSHNRVGAWTVAADAE
jgi:vacuolar-type H+-ATPase subunit B/Vma2